MNRNLAPVALAAASLGGAVSWHFATEHATAPTYVHAQGGAPSLTFAPMVKKIAPAVVNISSTRLIQTSPTAIAADVSNRRLRRIFSASSSEMAERSRASRNSRERRGIGSGVIVSAGWLHPDE